MKNTCFLKLPGLALAVLLVDASARGDFVIVQKVEGNMQSGTMTIRMKDGKARADITPQLSTITDSASGDTITLLHTQKTFMRIPAERTRALMEQMQKIQGATPPPTQPPQLKPANKKEKIENYECELYTWSAPGVEASYWIAKDYPNAAGILAAMEKNLNSGLTGLARGMTPRPTEFPGMVMKTEMTINGQRVLTSLVSVAEENVDPALFEIPKTYKEAPTPVFDAPGPE